MAPACETFQNSRKNLFCTNFDFNYPDFLRFLRLFIFFFTCTLRAFFYAICFLSSMDLPSRRTYQADKNLISLPIRHLLYQKFRIILNIVLIVNEFECCVSFFPQHQFCWESKCCSCVGFLQFLKARKKFLPPQQKTLEASGRNSDGREVEEKKSVMCIMNEWENDEEKKNTNVQKSHFYLLFAPLPPCLLLL